MCGAEGVFARLCNSGGQATGVGTEFSVQVLDVAMIAAILESRSLGSGAFVMLPRV